MFGRKARKLDELEARIQDLECDLELQHELNAEIVARLDSFERQQDKHGNALRELRHAPKS